MKNKRLKLCIQCIDPQGRRGTFLIDEDTGVPATRTFDSAWRLFVSAEYQRLKVANEINLDP